MTSDFMVFGMNDAPAAASGSGVWEVLETLTPSGVSTFTTSAIGSSYTLIRLLGVIDLPASANLGMRFNGDTGNNYNWLHVRQQSGATVNSTFTNYAYAKLAISGSAGIFACDIQAHNYAAGSAKAYLSHIWGNEIGNDGGGNWDNTADKITSITLYNAAAGNFGARTKITVMGSSVLV